MLLLLLPSIEIPRLSSRNEINSCYNKTKRDLELNVFEERVVLVRFVPVWFGFHLIQVSPLQSISSHTLAIGSQLTCTRLIFRTSVRKYKQSTKADKDHDQNTRCRHLCVPLLRNGKRDSS